MKNNWNTVRFCYCVNVFCTSYSAKNLCALTFKFNAFTSEETSTAVRELNNNWSFCFSSSFKNSVDSISVDYVYCRKSKFVCFCYFKYFLYVIARNHTRFYKIEDLRHGNSPIYSIVLRLKNLSLKICNRLLTTYAILAKKCDMQQTLKGEIHISPF